MSDAGGSGASSGGHEPDWWSRRFGDRGILQLIIGNDAQFLVVLIATCTIAYVIAVKGHYDTLGMFMNFLFLVVTLYFLYKLVRLWTAGQRTVTRTR